MRPAWQVARRGIEVRLSRAEQKAERASSRLRTLREDAMQATHKSPASTHATLRKAAAPRGQAAHGMVRVSLLFGQLADEVERALEQVSIPIQPPHPSTLQEAHANTASSAMAGSRASH